MKRRIRRLVKVGLVAGMGYAAYRVFNNQAPGRYEPLTAPPAPTPPTPTTAPKPGTVRSVGVGEVPHHVAKWVEPGEGGACPTSHPVKAKTESGIYHVEGGRYYDRVTPDRCYRDEEAARSDGLRPSKQ